MKEKIKVLILEDLPSDAELAEREVKAVLKNYTAVVTDTEQGFIKALENFKPDLIISDYMLPAFNGMKALQITRKKEQFIPFIILTGSMNEETAVECIKAGADDYVIKEHIKRLGLAILNALDKKKNRQERERADKALRESKKQLQTLIDNMPDFICFKDGDGRWLLANESGIRIFQLEGIDYLGKKDSELAELNKKLQGSFLTCKESDARAWKENCLIHAEETVPDADGSDRIYDVTKVPVSYSDGELKGLIVIGHDITERKQAEKIQDTLFNISNALNTTDNLHDLYSKIREFLGDVIDTTNFYVALYDKKTDLISLPFDVDEKDSYETFPAGKTLTAYVIKTGKPLFASKQLQDELAKQGKIEIIGTRSEIWLGVPLKVENKVIGVIVVQSYDDPHLYSEKDIDILTFISEEIALAINHKQAGDQIQRDLKEKTLLLQEIHHRVKNNLQVISGLLMLQENEITTKEDAIKGFAASQDRILAMAKAYELLLGSKYKSEVNVGKYIESLTEQLKYNYDIHHKVKINYSMDDFTVSIEVLDRLGLVFNEIITNSIKYAFEGRDSGNINIKLKEKKGSFVVKISDDGIGIPKDIDVENPESLGLSLVGMLTTQLGGTFTLNRKNGTSFTLEIPKKYPGV